MNFTMAKLEFHRGIKNYLSDFEYDREQRIVPGLVHGADVRFHISYILLMAQTG